MRRLPNGDILTSMQDYVSGLVKMPVRDDENDTDILSERRRTQYMQLIGRLNWLQSCKARPEARHPTLLVSQRQQQPTVAEVRAANKVVNDLVLTKGLVIRIPRLVGELQITTISD